MPDGYLNPDGVVLNSHGGGGSPSNTIRQRSKIGFCYVDLADATRVARALCDLGRVPCDRDQLAGKMGHTLSGAFVNKTSAAAQFGLIEFAHGKIKLTPLGYAILDKDRSAAAKVEAFLRVALHRRIYEEFRNGQLPPSRAGLEQAITEFGVPEKQKEKARRAFENSAQQAGFFENGNGRLVAPVLAKAWDAIDANQIAENQSDRIPPKRSDGEQMLPPPAEHPFIKGLLLSLPTELRVSWTADERVKWLRTAADAFELMFTGGSPITITFSSSAE